MKILIDIGHPAHVHYFRNLISKLDTSKYSVLIVARDKEVTHQLLRKYDIDYISRGSGKNSIIGKLFYLIFANIKIGIIAVTFKPDIFLSFSSPYAAQISWLFRKPHIAFTDTEHATLGNLMFVPFSTVVCTPYCFQKDYGKKHIKFRGFLEQSYLDKKYFIPDETILKEIGVKNNERFIILRFVSWNASHDIGQGGLDDITKIALVDKLAKYAKIFISSEGKLPAILQPHKLSISPDKLHDVLYYAELYVGEGATMASECAMLGTPAIYVNSLSAGTIEEQSKAGLIYSFRDSKGVLPCALELLKNPNMKEDHAKKYKEMLSDNIDVTEFMVRTVDKIGEEYHH